MNIFDLPNLPLQEELTTILAKGQNVRIERIISTGQTSDWYDQDEAEFVVLLNGKAQGNRIRNLKTQARLFAGFIGISA